MSKYISYIAYYAYALDKDDNIQEEIRFFESQLETDSSREDILNEAFTSGVVVNDDYDYSEYISPNCILNMVVKKID